MIKVIAKEKVTSNNKGNGMVTIPKEQKIITNTSARDTTVLNALEQWALQSYIPFESKVFLTGGAGSGKTYTILELIKFLKQHKIIFTVTATTHMAVDLLNKEGIKATTLYRALGSASLNDAEINGSNSVNVRLNTSSSNLIKKENALGLLIIDEVSMMSNKDVINLIETYPGKILFVGDLEQLTIENSTKTAPYRLNDLPRYELVGSNRAKNPNILNLHAMLKDLLSLNLKGKDYINKVSPHIEFKDITAEELYADKDKQYIAFTNNSVINMSEKLLHIAAMNKDSIKITLYNTPSFYIHRPSFKVDNGYVDMPKDEYKELKYKFSNYVKEFKPLLGEIEAEKVIEKYERFVGQRPARYSLNEILYSVYTGISRIEPSNTLIGDYPITIENYDIAHLTYEEFCFKLNSGDVIPINGTYNKSIYNEEQEKVATESITGWFNFTDFCLHFKSDMYSVYNNDSLPMYPDTWQAPHTVKNTINMINKGLKIIPGYRPIKFFEPIIRYKIKIKDYSLNLFEDYEIRKEHLKKDSEHPISQYTRNRDLVARHFLEKVLGITKEQFKTIDSPVNTVIEILGSISYAIAQELADKSMGIDILPYIIGHSSYRKQLSTCFKYSDMDDTLKVKLKSKDDKAFLDVTENVMNYTKTIRQHKDETIYYNMYIALMSLNSLCHDYGKLPYIRSAQTRTVHKAQGNSYKEVYFNTYGVSTKLIYVALTRATEQAYLTKDIA